MQKGIDVTAPPTHPRHFVVRRGYREDLLLVSESECSDSEDSDAYNDKLNTGMIESSEGCSKSGDS